MAAMSLTSCRSLQYAQSSGSIMNPLPALEPRIDLRSLEDAYSRGEASSTGMTWGAANSFVHTTNSSTTYQNDPRVRDAINLFEKETKDNITMPYGKKRGYITFKITESGTKSMLMPLLTLEIVLLLPIPLMLLGLPVGYQRSFLTLEVEIYNMADELVGRYKQSCNTGKKWSATWWGYSYSTLGNKLPYNALVCAMEGIKTQISNDAQRLKKELQQ
jgi:hypothetical protein